MPAQVRVSRLFLDILERKRRIILSGLEQAQEAPHGSVHPEGVQVATGEAILAAGGGEGGGGDGEGVLGIISISCSASERQIRPILPCVTWEVGGLTSGTILKLKSSNWNTAINVMGAPKITPRATIASRMKGFAWSKADA